MERSILRQKLKYVDEQPERQAGLEVFCRRTGGCGHGVVGTGLWRPRTLVNATPPVSAQAISIRETAWTIKRPGRCRKGWPSERLRRRERSASGQLDHPKPEWLVDLTDAISMRQP